jgi:hypothetical protein
MHRYSQHSNKHVCFTCEGSKAYVCDVTSNKSHRVGTGAPYDYYPGSISLPTDVQVGELRVAARAWTHRATAHFSPPLPTSPHAWGAARVYTVTGRTHRPTPHVPGGQAILIAKPIAKR